MPSRIRTPFQCYGRASFTATWSTGTETITLLDGFYWPHAVQNSINALKTGPYSFAVSTTAQTSTVTTTASVTFDFADADLAAYLGFSTTAFTITGAATLGNTEPVEHSAYFSESPGDLRYQRRFVGNASQAIDGALGRPTCGYHDTIQFVLWANADEVIAGLGALRRLAREGGYFLFDGVATTPWHLEHLNGMARIMFIEPRLMLGELVEPEADTIRQLNFDCLVEGMGP